MLSALCSAEAVNLDKSITDPSYANLVSNKRPWTLNLDNSITDRSCAILLFARRRYFLINNQDFKTILLGLQFQLIFELVFHTQHMFFVRSVKKM